MAVLAFATPVKGQNGGRIQSNDVRISHLDSSLQTSDGIKSVTTREDESGFFRIFRTIYLSGGLELGRALSNATSDSAGIVLDAPSRPSTTLTGNATLDWGRLSLTGFGGTSLSRTNRGSFGRAVGIWDIARNPQGISLWQIGGDYTAVQSPRVSSLTSSGISMRIGNPRLLQAGVRYGGRQRASRFTPVTAVDLVRTSSWWIKEKTLFSVQASATGVWTKAPRLAPVTEDFASLLRGPERRIIGDLALNFQLARGAWAVGSRVVQRIGRSPAIWDDPIPNQRSVVGQGTDGYTAAVARVLWVPLDNFVVSGEVGRQLSDPVYGLSGVRYVSLSARMNFEVGRRRIAWLEQQRISRAADVAALRSTRYDAFAVIGSSETTEKDAEQLIVIRDVVGDNVEIAGDFTQWKPIPLRRCPEQASASDSSVHDLALSDSTINTSLPKAISSVASRTWCAEVSLPSGVYHVVYRSDGGEWRVPPGLTSVNDDMGTATGLLIIP